MELRRNIYQKLLEWKKEDSGQVLEVKGARQVGKTYLLKEFGRENYEGVAYFNFDHDEDLYNYFIKYICNIIPLTSVLMLLDGFQVEAPDQNICGIGSSQDFADDFVYLLIICNCTLPAHTADYT